MISGFPISFQTGLHVIAGVNGAGETILFKCIAGLENYRGTITWDDTSTAGHVADSFDDSPTHPGLTGF